MKPELMERLANISSMAEFDPALILLPQPDLELKPFIGIMPFALLSRQLVKLVLGSIRRRLDVSSGLQFMFTSFRKSSALLEGGLICRLV